MSFFNNFFQLRSYFIPNSELLWHFFCLYIIMYTSFSIFLSDLNELLVISHFLSYSGSVIVLFFSDSTYFTLFQMAPSESHFLPRILWNFSTCKLFHNLSYLFQIANYIWHLIHLNMEATFELFLPNFILCFYSPLCLQLIYLYNGLHLLVFHFFSIQTSVSQYLLPTSWFVLVNFFLLLYYTIHPSILFLSQ